MTNHEISLIEETLRNYGESFQEWNIEIFYLYLNWKVSG